MSEPQPLLVGRFCVGIEIYDNETKQQLVSDGFNTSHLYEVVSALRKAAQIVQDEARKDSEAPA